ncbi:MAG: aminopeptidase N [Hyphomonadaceae bacterium]|nr:MAG: aminopeptidase N [Hyphomonadaceae bacterium]
MKNQAKTYLSEYKPFPYSIASTSIVFELSPTRTIVSTKLRIQPNLSSNAINATLVLDGEGLEIIEIKVDGRILTSTEYEYQNDKLTIPHFASERFVLETKVAINPSANHALSGLYMSGGRFCTQCEAEGFRRITFFPDRPDVLSHFFVRLEATKDEYPILLANGNRVSFGDFGDGRHFVEWDDPFLKPTYLFAIVAGGNLDVISDKFLSLDNKQVELNIYVDKGDAGKAHYAMDSLKRAMKWDEDEYRRIYDLDIFNIVAVRDFNFGAMENKGLNIFNSSLLLADSETATDVDFSRIESVVAHEYFHNWSGNRVTCRDWFQLSLKEGFTVFRDQEFSADMRSRAVCRIGDVIMLRNTQFLEDAGPNAHPVRPESYVAIDNFYTSTIYNKGAEVIRIAKNILGTRNFLQGAINYFETNDGKAATIEDWLAALRGNDGDALNGIEKWYSQAGTPEVTISSDFDLAAKCLRLNFNQKTPDTPNQIDKLPVPIPIKMAFFDRDGKKLAILPDRNTSTIGDLNFTFDSETATLEFDGIETKPIVSVLRDFSAPVKINFDIDDDDLAVLAAFDDDPFVRWESVQIIARREITAGYKKLVSGKKFVPSAKLIDIFGHAFNEPKKNFAALLLLLPSISEMMSLIKDCAPEIILEAKNAISTAIYARFAETIIGAVQAYNFAATFTPDAQSAGGRAFLSSCLYYASFAPTDTAKQILKKAYSASQNMTDVMSVLSAMSRIGGEIFNNAMAHFADKWQHNPLVMDKWFSLQAASPAGNPIAKFDELLAHKDFEITNPNRVRAVVSSFSISNPIAFHAEDGLGYKKLADFLLKLDKVNQIGAARLAPAFARVTMVAPKRRAIAKQVLQQTLDKKISSLLQEIVAPIVKSL